MAGAKQNLKVLVVTGHPRGQESLTGALAEAFADGAERAGSEVRRVFLDQLSFDPHVLEPTPKLQPLEPDLEEMRLAFEWAGHLVFFYPTWWGTYPALLKGLFDRLLVDGWAFEETTGGTGFEGRLGGRTAELITTMDTPGPVYSLILGAPGRKALSLATLGFCEIEVVRHTRFGIVKESDAATRSDWIEESRALGSRLVHPSAVRTPRQILWQKISPWLAAMRLQFYPMTFIAYLVGALLVTVANRENAGPIDMVGFLLGYGVLFFGEVATVFFNDLFDFESDRRNRHYSNFTGGSRVLVTGRLPTAQLRKGAVITLAIAIGFLAWLLLRDRAGAAPLAAALGGTALLALAYTLPPAKLCHRGLGELTVGVTHAFGAVLSGYVIQGGALSDLLPWVISVPLFFAVVCAITLAGVPDADADRAAGKRTLAVILSPRTAMTIAAWAAGLAALSAVFLALFSLSSGLLDGLWLVALVHGAWLIPQIVKTRKQVSAATRIDGLLANALTYILWFGLVPLIHLISR